MTGIEGQPILTATQMRAVEERSAPTPEAMYALMERAGAGVAETVRRLAAGADVLILCGSGNNGGDGYVAVRVLREQGHPVRVAALAEPRTPAAAEARRRWHGPIERFPSPSLQDEPAVPIVVDALVGTGLSRPLDEAAAIVLGRLIDGARLSIAVDLPSHIDTNTGALFNAEQVGPVDLTLALGALKPSHLLMPAAPYCGALRVIDLGLEHVDWTGRVIDRPEFLLPGVDDHKYSRGLVVVIGGAMPGAARLAAEAAARAGAGYVMLLGDEGADASPHAIVRRAWSPEALAQAIDGKRNAVLLVGPGLGRNEAARDRLSAAIDSRERLVIDGDALHLLDPVTFATFWSRDDDHIVLTPHEGEFRALFGDWSGSKIDATCRAAARAGATVAFKGPDTVVATRHGEVFVSSMRQRWLSTAGTGDVLTGAIAAAIVNMAFPNPASAGVWMHSEAARRSGGAFVADDLARELSAVRASL